MKDIPLNTEVGGVDGKDKGSFIQALSSKRVRARAEVRNKMRCSQGLWRWSHNSKRRKSTEIIVESLVIGPNVMEMGKWQ